MLITSSSVSLPAQQCTMEIINIENENVNNKLLHQLLETILIIVIVIRFKGISNNQSIRGRPDSSNNQSLNKKELRQRKASPGDNEKNVNDDEIVESCKVELEKQE